MTDYFGTDQDDIIDASNLDPDVKNINSGAGNDKISNVSISLLLKSKLRIIGQ